MKCAVVLLLLMAGVYFHIGTEAAPSALPSALMNCVPDDCDWNSGPVCAIDASGITRNFQNQCMAYIKACHSDTYYAEVKPGDC